MPTCKLKNCPYNTNGRCVENQLPDCPNLGDDLDVSQEEEALAPGEGSPPVYENFFSGKKLTLTEVTEILQARPAMLVMLGGFVECGKTTLIARIFEMFQAGDVSDFDFTASRTLSDFDKITWHATMECGASSPSTEHTSRAENNLFLHLRIRRKTTGEEVDLLIGDIPGEIFPEAVAEQSVIETIHGLRRANHLVLVLDGEILADQAARHDHCGKVFDFTDRALHTGQIGKHTYVHLVISKTDRLPVNEKDEVHTFIKYTEEMFKSKFKPSVAGINTWKLAARPVHPQEPTLEKINNIFNCWLSAELQGIRRSVPALEMAAIQRDFSRFGLSK